MGITVGVGCLLYYYFVVDWCVPHADCCITVMIMPCCHLRRWWRRAQNNEVAASGVEKEGKRKSPGHHLQQPL
jgi:hypothetical protein